MASAQSKVFLSKIHELIASGSYDKYLEFPFVTKELIYTSIKARVLLKESKGGNPMLTDGEIKECMNDAKETAANTAYAFFQAGILERDEKGGLKISEKGQIALREVSRIE